MTIEDVDNIIETLKNKNYVPIKNDIAFNILRDIVGCEVAGYLVFKAPVTKLQKYATSNKSRLIRKMLAELGVGPVALKKEEPAKTVSQEPVNKETVTAELTKEQNKADLIELLGRIRVLTERGELLPRDAVKLESDIRVRLNDKFEMEKSEDERRIIVVPQKHDMVCPHTHHECTYMPTKKACMDYYKLKDNDEN